MFGLGRKRRYHGAVDIKLREDYGIATRRDNPLFPRVLAYLELLDNAYRAKMSEDEAALNIATLYCCGIARHGFEEEAGDVLDCIHAAVDAGLTKGTISMERWLRCEEHLREARQRLESAGNPARTDTPRPEVVKRNLDHILASRSSRTVSATPPRKPPPLPREGSMYKLNTALLAGILCALTYIAWRLDNPVPPVSMESYKASTPAERAALLDQAPIVRVIPR